MHMQRLAVKSMDADETPEESVVSKSRPSIGFPRLCPRFLVLDLCKMSASQGFSDLSPDPLAELASLMSCVYTYQRSPCKQFSQPFRARRYVGSGAITDLGRGCRSGAFM